MRQKCSAGANTPRHAKGWRQLSPFFGIAQPHQEKQRDQGFCRLRAGDLGLFCVRGREECCSPRSSSLGSPESTQRWHPSRRVPPVPLTDRSPERGAGDLIKVPSSGNYAPIPSPAWLLRTFMAKSHDLGHTCGVGWGDEARHTSPSPSLCTSHPKNTPKGLCPPMGSAPRLFGVTPQHPPPAPFRTGVLGKPQG